MKHTLKCLLLTGAVTLLASHFSANSASADHFYYGYGPAVVAPAPAYYAPAPAYYAPAPAYYAPAPVYSSYYAAPTYYARPAVGVSINIGRVYRPVQTIRVRPVRTRVRYRW